MVTAQKSIQSAQPYFSRHDSFPPRNGWLKKGFDAFSSDPAVFNREDVAVVLGVGKNMAKAIRYWCTAFKISEEVFDKETKSKTMLPTEFGLSMFSDDGWDPYTEDPGSLWLLHWKLLKSPCTASCWNFAFNNYRHLEFSQEDFQTALSEFTKQTWLENSFSEATLENDVSCFTRMYCKDERAKNVSEETISSPFTDLNLLAKMTDNKHYAFHVGAKSSLPSAIICAAVMDYVDTTRTTERSVSISQLVYGNGSPGLVFKLPESAIYAALEELADKRKDMHLSQTAGMVQLQFTKEPMKIAESILSTYFASGRR